jgi:hypothetical protein
MFHSIIWWTPKLVSRPIFAGNAAVMEVKAGEVAEQGLLWSPKRLS